MPALPGCACVVLAAGGSRRLGEPKQLLRVAGETLIHRTVRLALEAGCSPVCVVLGSRAEEMRSALAGCSVLIVKNADWQEGMSTSLRAGVLHVVAAQPQLTHLLVMVCDQPKLSAEVLADLLAAGLSSPGQVVASSYDGHLGVPAIFPAAFFSHLLQVEGDRGARGGLEALRDEVVAVEFSGGVEDIDTPEDARRAGLV